MSAMMSAICSIPIFVSMWKAWLAKGATSILTSRFGNEFRTFIPTIGITWEHFSVIELTRGAEQQRM